jgi:hypothetical protein
MNYTELRQAIIDYTETDETIFVQNIPTFVEQAEERIYNTVQIPALRRNVTGNTTATNKYLACPDDFLSVFSMAAVDATGRYEYMLNKDVNFIRQAYPNPNSQGLPRYYALFGPRAGNSNELAFILGPTPDAAYAVELHYFYYPESIVTAGTSWLGDNYSPVLLYGALREAYLFQKGEQDLIANVEAKYNEALAQLKRLGDGLERGDAYRDGQTKLQYNKL